MKSYLSLIPLSAKVHKGQSRMTRLCIAIAVFLVTAVFSMADMDLRMELSRLEGKHGALGLMDILQSAMVQTLLPTVGALFILILLAGVLMISSSLNSTVAQRTKFFGMMRCLGMSHKQVIRFVRLEALHWCRLAIPLGVLAGVVASWGLCAALRFAVGEEFATIPLFGLSSLGIVAGILLGLTAVLLAARAPAKRAAAVSPITAVTGNAQSAPGTGSRVSARLFKIDTALGVHHTLSSKKSLMLMTGSFALSIILFLCFLVLIDFVGYLLPQSASTYELSFASSDGNNAISSELVTTLEGMPSVKRVFGRSSRFDVPAVIDSAEPSSQAEPSSKAVDVIGYDAFDLDCLVKDNLLQRGSEPSKVYGDSPYALATWDEESPLKQGDSLHINGETLQIAGLLRYDPFNSDGLTHGKTTLITSGDTFARLTGTTAYSLVMVQLAPHATDEDVAAISQLTDDSITFRDARGESTAGTYTAFALCIYAFIAIITLVAVLNMLNSISMSVSARTKQYGVMRAIGMSLDQIKKMIAAEAVTYALFGCAAGLIIGLWLSRLIFQGLIVSHFSYASWELPMVPLLIILVIMAAATAAAVHAPSKRLSSMAVTATINEL